MDRALAVPMVTARVSRRETYAQIVTALTALDEASASVFDGVAARVDGLYNFIIPKSCSDLKSFEPSGT